MAYYTTPSYDYDQYNDNNYQYYQPYNYDQPHESESRYVHHQYYSDHTEYYGNAYQQAPTESLVGYHYSTYYNNNNNNYTDNSNFFASKNVTFHENDDYCYDPVSTQAVISYSTADTKVKDLEFEEYHIEPYHGGYDIYQTYGKALPPSDDICYPPTKVATNSNQSLVLDDSLNSKGTPSPHGKESPKLEGEATPNPNPNPNPIPANVIIPVAAVAEAAQVEDVLDSEEDEDYDDDEEEEEDYNDDEEEEKEENEEIVQNLEGEAKPTNVIQEENVSKIEDNQVQEQQQEEEQIRGGIGDDQARNGGDSAKEIRRQIPSGYGLEAVDICDGLFGGYFPCLLKRNYKGKACDTCGGEVKKKIDDYECWQGTVDYLFGNPEPYGGAMPEKGSYGDPVYSYQRHQPQQSISGQVQYEESSTWLHNTNLHSSSSRYIYGPNYGDYGY